MSETIISKQCSRCKQPKPLSEFYKDKTTKDGYYYYCKKCHNQSVRRYACTQRGKENFRKRRKRYQRTEKYKVKQRAWYHRYKDTPRGKELYNRYPKTEKGKANSHRQRKKYRRRYPDKYKAHDPVNKAVRAGNLPRVTTRQCNCGKQARRYHHHNGYDEAHWLDVIPLCVKCHFAAHKKISLNRN